jgi:hypothetical protein
MRFIQMQGFTVRLDRQLEFQRWVAANEERIRKSYPEGGEFGGIYTAVFSSEKGAGEYFWLDILDSYAALDRGAAMGKDPTSESAKLTEEFLRFVDFDRAAGQSNILMKSVVDATIFDAPHD